MSAVTLVLRQKALAALLKGLLPHLPKKLSDEDRGVGVGVVRLVAVGSTLLGLAVTKDRSTAVCVSAPIVEIDDAGTVEAWLDRAAVDALAGMGSAGEQVDVEVRIFPGRRLEAREVGALWGGWMIRVPLLDVPEDPRRACAARMLLRASSARLEARGRAWVRPRDVRLMDRTATAVGQALRMSMGSFGAPGEAVVVWGAMPGTSYLAVTSASVLAEDGVPPLLEEVCYDGELIALLMEAVLEDLSSGEGVEERFAAEVLDFVRRVWDTDAVDGDGDVEPEGTEGPEGGDVA